MTVKDSIKKIASNSGIVLSGNLTANVFGLFATAILTHSVGVKNYGYYVLFTAYVTVINRIFNFQTWQAFVKYGTDFKENGENGNLLMLIKYSFFVDVFSLFFAVVIAFVSGHFFLSFFEIPKEFYMALYIYIFIIFFDFSNISKGIFRVFDNFKLDAKVVAYASIFKMILFGFAAIFYPAFYCFILIVLIAKIFSMILSVIYVKKVLNYNGFSIDSIVTKRINFRLIKQMKIFSFIFYNNFNVSVRMISRELDVFLLGKFYSPESVGIFKIAKLVAGIVGKLTDPVYQAIYPEFAKLLSKGRKNEAKSVAIKITIYSSIFAVASYVLFLLLGDYFILQFFGTEFSQSYSVVLIYYVAIFIAIITLTIYPMINAFGYAKEAFLNQFIATMIYVPFLFFAVHSWSSKGAAIAYVFYYIFLTFLSIRTVKKGFANE